HQASSGLVLLVDTGQPFAKGLECRRFGECIYAVGQVIHRVLGALHLHTENLVWRPRFGIRQTLVKIGLEQLFLLQGKLLDFGGDFYLSRLFVLQTVANLFEFGLSAFSCTRATLLDRRVGRLNQRFTGDRVHYIYSYRKFLEKVAGASAAATKPVFSVKNLRRISRDLAWSRHTQDFDRPKRRPISSRVKPSK